MSRKGGRRVASDLISSLTRLSSTVLTSSALIMSILLGFYFSANSSQLTSIATSISKYAATKPIGDYITSNLEKSVGAITVGGAVFSATNSQQALGSLMASVFLIVGILPKGTIAEYAILAVALAAFLKSRTTKLRFAVIAIAIATVLAGYWGSSFLA